MKQCSFSNASPERCSSRCSCSTTFPKTNTRDRCQLAMDDETHVASYLKMWYEDMHHALDRRSFCGSLPSLVMVAFSLDFYQTHVQEFPTQLRHGHEEATSFRCTILECMCKATHRTASYMSSAETSVHLVYAAGVLVSSIASYTDISWGNDVSSKFYPICILWRQLTRFFLS